MKKIIATVLSVILSFGSLISVAKASKSEEIKMCAYTQLGDISPYTIESDTQYELVRYVFDSLYYIDESDRATEMMGHSLNISDDKKEYRITLRDDLKWHDGTPVTVDDVIYSYMNAKNVDWFKASVRSLDTVTADGNTLIFKLKYPNPVFMKEAVVYLPIVPKSYYEKGEYVSIGSGAYSVAEKSAGKYILNSTNYYLKETTANKIQIDVLQDEQACINGVKDTQYATVFGSLSPESFEEMKKTMNDRANIYGMSTKVLFLNNEKLSDSRLRKAISLAIDYDKIVNDMYKGHAVKGAPGFFSMDLGYSNKGLTSYTNIEEAKQLLQNNGYSIDGGVLKDNAGNPVSLKLLSVSGKDEQIANAIKDAIGSIGIGVVINIVDEQHLLSEVQMGNYEGAVMNLGSYYQFSESNLDLLMNGGYANYSIYNSAKANEALAAYKSTMDPYDRYDRLMELQSVIGEEAPFIPLCNPNHLNVYEKSVYNTYAFKEGVGIHSVLSFISNRKYIDMKHNDKVVSGAEQGNTLMAGAAIIGIIIIGFLLYLIINRKRNKQ